MKSLPDDPVIACMERTGYPPWFFYGKEEGDEDEEPDADGDADGV